MGSSEVTAPTWLNRSFLEAALRSSEGDESIKVTSHEVSRATAAGDNYASEMYRVKANFTQRGHAETRSLIVKAEPEKEEMAKVLSEANIFERETVALAKLVPEMHRLLKKITPSELRPMSAKYIYKHSQPSAIVMEDLKEQGYKMAERTLGLDLKHSLLVIKNIARYHASSVVLYQEHPELFKVYLQSVFAGKLRQTIELFFGRSMKNLAHDVDTWSGFDDRVAAKLKAIAEKATDLLIDVLKRDDSEFNVLTHGDLWLNNMMFLYSKDTGEVEDVKFVDYQLGYLGSPAQDLQYFLHTSVSADLIDKHHILIEEYYKTLGGTFTSLGYKHLIPSMTDLQKQLDKKGVYAVIVCCSVLPVVLSDTDNIPDLEKILKQETHVQFSKVFKTAFMKILPVFEKKGWL